MSGRERPKDPPRAGAPMWIVTFTDMSSLLLTFFIMILTFSSMDTEKLQKAQGSLRGEFGVIESMRRSRRDTVEDPRIQRMKRDEVGTLAHDRHDQVDDMVDKIQRRDVFDVQVTADVRGKRIRIVPKDGQELFSLIDGRLAGDTEQILDEIGTMFRGLPYRLVVETHVDDRTWKITRSPSSQVYTLERGLVAAAVLEAAGVGPERVAVSPRGDGFPLKPNDDPAHRFVNRRIEILAIPDYVDPLYSSSGRF